MEFGEDLELQRSQEMSLATIEVRKIADGLGYGDGGISHDDRLKDVGPDTLQRIVGLIQNPKEILIPISLDKNGEPIADDGCIDGRETGEVMEGQEERKKSLVRSKVPGGGATMIFSSLIGLGRTNDQSVKSLYLTSIEQINGSQISFGAHTDEHAKELNSGCGAIDNAPAIISNVFKYEAQITSTIENDLGIDSTGLGDVFDSYREYAISIDGQHHAGAEILEEIRGVEKVVKKLKGGHLEGFIILNDVDGFTVDQNKPRQMSDGKVQVFCVDVWRLRQLVEEVHLDASAEDKHKAFLSEIVYSLATTATLTKGDLPVYAISKQTELVVA